jgi:hypothetical protein
MRFVFINSDAAGAKLVPALIPGTTSAIAMPASCSRAAAARLRRA